MPRRREVAKREPQPDPIYNSGLVSFFINVVMKQGKKSTAESLVYGAFDKIRDRTQEDPLKVFKKSGGQREAHFGSQEPPRRRQ